MSFWQWFLEVFPCCDFRNSSCLFKCNLLPCNQCVLTVVTIRNGGGCQKWRHNCWRGLLWCCLGLPCISRFLFLTWPRHKFKLGDSFTLSSLPFPLYITAGAQRFLENLEDKPLSDCFVSFFNFYSFFFLLSCDTWYSLEDCDKSNTTLF